jgi:hypothetical protein
MFFSPKSYALKYYDNTFLIKIKGYNQKNIVYDDLLIKQKTNEKLIINNYTFLSKKNLKLIFQETEKKFDLNLYDKRYFINQYETAPYFYNNYTYEKAD